MYLVGLMLEAHRITFLLSPRLCLHEDCKVEE